MPWAIPLVTAAISGVSALSAGAKRRKAERAIENMQTPTYSPNQSILDYYQKALQKYETTPTDSAEYKLQKQNILQGTQQGLSALKDRRLAGAGTPALMQNQNNSLLKAAVAGEQRKAQDFARLGQATQMKAAEEGKAFNQNQIVPFEKQYNLLAMKAAGKAAAQNAATQNMYNNANAAASILSGGDGGDGYNGIFSGESKFGKRYGSQSAGAYNWAKNNNMNFGQYSRTAKKVGKKLDGFGYY